MPSASLPLDVVAVEQEAGVVGVRPQPDAAVVVHPVASHAGIGRLPELAAAGAPAARLTPLPVVGVVAGDLVATQDDVADTVGLVRTEAVLSVAQQAVEGRDRSVSEKDPGARVVHDRVVGDGPVVPAVVVDDTLVRRADEVPDGQVGDGDVGRLPAERVAVESSSVEHRARSTGDGLASSRRHLLVLAVPEVVLARLEPERGPRGRAQHGALEVGRRADDASTGRRRARSGQPLGAADARGRLPRRRERRTQQVGRSRRRVGGGGRVGRLRRAGLAASLRGALHDQRRGADDQRQHQHKDAAAEPARCLNE